MAGVCGEHILDSGDELRPVQSGIAMSRYQVIPPCLKRASASLRGKARHAVAAVQHDFSVGKRLFVVIYTQNRALGFHQPSAIFGAQARLRNRQRFFLNMKNVRAR